MSPLPGSTCRLSSLGASRWSVGTLAQCFGVDYRARMIVKLPGNPWSAPTLKPPPRVLLGEPDPDEAFRASSKVFEAPDRLSLRLSFRAASCDEHRRFVSVPQNWQLSRGEKLCAMNVLASILRTIPA